MASLRQATHVFVGLQYGVGAAQFMAEVHWTQECVVVSHTGVIPEHVALVWQVA